MEINTFTEVNIKLKELEERIFKLEDKTQRMARYNSYLEELIVNSNKNLQIDINRVASSNWIQER